MAYTLQAYYYVRFISEVTPSYTFDWFQFRDRLSNKIPKEEKCMSLIIEE